MIIIMALLHHNTNPVLKLLIYTYWATFCIFFVKEPIRKCCNSSTAATGTQLLVPGYISKSFERDLEPVLLVKLLEGIQWRINNHSILWWA